MKSKRKTKIKELLLGYQSEAITLSNSEIERVKNAEVVVQEIGGNSQLFVDQLLSKCCSNSRLRQDIAECIKKETSSSLKLQELQQQILKKEKENQVREQRYLLRTKLVDLYKENLGFHLKSMNGSGGKSQLLFSFKNTNENKPEQFYSFILAIDGRTYSVTNCVPPIEGMEDFLRDLNKSNDLSLFVRLVKRKFHAHSKLEVMSNGHH